MTLRVHPRTTLTELPDGTGVVLHLGSKLVVSLNETGLIVWKAIAAGEARTVDDLARLLVDRFEVDDQTARADAAELVDELVEDGLLLREGPR